jgi:sterol 3beta-glucosyltransferase
MLKSEFNRARREVLDLPPVPFYGPIASFLGPRLCLDGYSALVAPRPRDWGASHYVAGYWFLDSDTNWQPPKALADFLSAGPAPICIGFGSMHDREAATVTELVKNALDRSEQRGILISGWGGLQTESASDRVFSIESAPHSWLFPRSAAVVHHGGAGTTAAALRAGVPSLIVPFMADQPFWGRRVYALGVGPEPIPHRRLTVDNLANSIRQMVADQAMRQRAAELGNRIRAEDGINRAIDLLERAVAIGMKYRPLGIWAAVRSSLRDSFGQRRMGG